MPGKGLRNLGNTCFVNAVIQALASLPIFVQWALQSSEDGRFGRLFSSLTSILSALNSSEATEECLETKEVLNALMSHGWVINFQQQDAHELFQVLMSTLEEELSESSGGLFSSLRQESSPPSKFLSKAGTVALPLRMSPFRGLLTSQLTCTSCKHKFPVRIEPFESLSLPIYRSRVSFLFDSSSLEMCLKNFTNSELVEDVVCDNCSKSGSSRQRCVKSLSILRPPKCLCVHLQRVTWSADNYPTKTESFVRFPLELDISPYTRRSSSKSRLYRLAAILVHLGEATSGHYITYRKLTSRNWLYTSDTDTRTVPVEEVLASNAYMLIYERHSSDNTK